MSKPLLDPEKDSEALIITIEDRLFMESSDFLSPNVLDIVKRVFRNYVIQCNKELCDQLQPVLHLLPETFSSKYELDEYIRIGRGFALKLKEPVDGVMYDAFALNEGTAASIVKRFAKYSEYKPLTDLNNDERTSITNS